MHAGRHKRPLKTKKLRISAGHIVPCGRDSVSQIDPDKSLEKCLDRVGYTCSPALSGPFWHMLSPWLLPLSFGVTLLLLCGMGFLIRTGVRTRNLARCWRCGAAKVRPSRPRSMDKLVGCLVLRPYRCAGCLTRFYAFRTFTPALPLAQIKAPFRIRLKVIVRVPWPRDWESAWQLLVAEEQGFAALPPANRSRPRVL